MNEATKTSQQQKSINSRLPLITTGPLVPQPIQQHQISQTLKVSEFIQQNQIRGSRGTQIANQEQIIKDIHEENHVDNQESGVIRDDKKNAKPSGSNDSQGQPSSPPSLNNQQKDKTLELTLEDHIQNIKIQIKRKSFLSALGLTIIGALILSIGFLGMGYSSHQITSSSATLDTDKNATMDFYNLPFYSSKYIFSAAMLLIVLVFVTSHNCVSYCKYGIFNQNEFYSKHGSDLRVQCLFLCLISSILFATGLMGLFYSWQLSQQLQLNCGIVTSLIAFIPSIIVVHQYIFQQKQVRALQIAGVALSISGLALLYLAISNLNITTEILSLNIPKAAIFMLYLLLSIGCLSSVLLLIIKIKRQGDLSYSSSIAMIIFIDGMFSVIPGILLLAIKKFLTVEQIVQSSGASSEDSLIVLQSKFVMITFSGVFIASAILAIAIANKYKRSQKLLAILVICPVIHFSIELIAEKQLNVDYSQISSVCLLIAGSLMLILGEQATSKMATKRRRLGLQKNDEIKRQIKDPLLVCEDLEATIDKSQIINPK